MNPIHARVYQRESPSFPIQARPSHRPRRNKVHPPHFTHTLGELRIQTRTFNPAVIMIHVPSKPALARHQLARWEAVIATHVLMRFASHQPRRNKVHPPHLTHALGALRIRTRTFNPAVIMIHVPSKPALARYQLACWKAIIATHVLMRSALARHQTTLQEAVTMTHPSQHARQNASK